MEKSNSKSSITMSINSDEANVPDKISWTYNSLEPDQSKPTKAFLLALWDDSEHKSLHMDIWTKEMTKDEMHHFIFQTINTLADTYQRATGNKSIGQKIAKMAGDLEKEARD